MECRYAEDPNNNFFPCIGRIHQWLQSSAGGVRYDTSVVSGSDISIYYDPLIAKVV
jgi:3-methylcrotonyl-CoA carboxylase alpha subunit